MAIGGFDNPFLHKGFCEGWDRHMSEGAICQIAHGSHLLRHCPVSFGRAFGMRGARVWANDYAPLGGLSAPSCNGETISSGKNDFFACLDQLKEESKADFLVWPFFPIEADAFGWFGEWVDPYFSQLESRLDEVCVRAHQRAVFDASSEVSEDGFSLRKKKRKELDRQLRRLGEQAGDGKHAVFRSSADDLAQDEALSILLDLEASGWKGRKGSALSSDLGRKQFVEHALREMMASGHARIDALFSGDHPVAALASLKAGRGLFTWKIGMDESYRRYSPGVQLMIHVSKLAQTDPDIDYIDSLAAPDHPMVDHIWAGRRRFATMVVPLTARGKLAASYHRALVGAEDALKQRVKALLARR